MVGGREEDDKKRTEGLLNLMHAFCPTRNKNRLCVPLACASAACVRIKVVRRQEVEKKKSETGGSRQRGLQFSPQEQYACEWHMSVVFTASSTKHLVACTYPGSLNSRRDLIQCRHAEI